MRNRGLSLLTCALLFAPSLAHAGANGGATAFLSWAGKTSTDLPSPTGTQNVYVNFDHIADFKGAEVVVIWTPDSGCSSNTGLSHMDLLFRTSGACTYLNRGTPVPIITDDGPGVLHVAWANSGSNSTCTSGVGLVIPFDFSSCGSQGGCMNLVSAIVLDHNNELDTVSLSGSGLTFRGGSATDCRPGPRGRTWAKIKSIYGHR